MRALKSKSLILDVYGAFVRDFGGWISISSLIELMCPLGYEEQATRTSVSRFAQNGLLERRIMNGVVGYELTPYAMRILEEGDDRIYERLDPGSLDAGWVLVTFSIPESIRSERHKLRSRLAWLGFGSLGGGAWIAPRRILEKSRRVVKELGLEEYVEVFESNYRGFSDPVDLVDKCWDLAQLRESYRQYIEDVGPTLERYRDVSVDEMREQAFVDYIYSLHEWRKLPFMDPGLPSELLPDGWEGKRAADIFGRFRELLEPAARRHVLHVLST